MKIYLIVAIEKAVASEPGFKRDCLWRTSINLIRTLFIKYLEWSEHVLYYPISACKQFVIAFYQLHVKYLYLGQGFFLMHLAQRLKDS